MSSLLFDLENLLTPILRSGDLLTCERLVAKRMNELPPTPFHVILELGITNSPCDVAAYFDEFFCQQPSDQIRAAYTEMNGFDINPQHWWCSPFAYQRYGGHEDYDWLF